VRFLLRYLVFGALGLPVVAAAQCDGFTPGPQSATLLANVMLDGEPAEAGDELWAHDGLGLCLGQATVILEQGLAFVNLTIYGDDPTTAEDEGLQDGESFVLSLHDVSAGTTLEFNAGAAAGTWANTNGAPLPDWNDPFATLDFSGPQLCVGDFDGSGAVEVTDLLDLLSTFGGACPGCATDLDGDGAVQVSDLLNLLSVFGTAC